MPDGVNCVVSFLDFHNSCDVVPLSSLRPFPIIAWVRTLKDSLKVHLHHINIAPITFSQVAV